MLTSLEEETRGRWWMVFFYVEQINKQQQQDGTTNNVVVLTSVCPFVITRVRPINTLSYRHERASRDHFKSATQKISISRERRQTFLMAFCVCLSVFLVFSLWLLTTIEPLFGESKEMSVRQPNTWLQSKKERKQWEKLLCVALITVFLIRKNVLITLRRVSTF